MNLNIKDGDGVNQNIYFPDEAEQKLLSESIGQKTDLESTNDNGTFSIISFFKRLLGYFTILLNWLPTKVSGKIPVKAELEANQQIAVSNFPAQIAGFSLEVTQLLIKAGLDSILSKIVPLAATEAKQDTQITVLNSILSELRDDISLSETVWTDDTNTYFIRQVLVNQDTGVITYSYVLPNGNSYTPVGNIRLAGLEKDREVIEALFVANANGDGYVINDIISRVDIIDVTASPFSNLAQVWFNRSQQTTINAPTAGHLNPNTTQNVTGNVSISNQISGFSTEAKQNNIISEIQALLTDTELRASPLNVNFPSGTDVIGTAGLSAINIDLLTNTVNGWLDVSAFQSGTIQILASAGISAGAIFFEQTNNNASTVGIPLPVTEVSSINTNPIIAAFNITASQNRLFRFGVNTKYIRVRISTAFVGGTVQAIGFFSDFPYSSPIIYVQQATAANLNANVSGTVGLSANQNITPIPQTGQGASTPHFRISTGDANLVLVKGSAGVINSMVLANMTASFKFFRIYNKATAPVIATDTALIVKYIPIPPNTTLVLSLAPFGDRFATGISYAITGAVGASDATNIGVNEVSVSIQYT